MSTVYVFTDFGGPETQQLLDRPAPQPGPGELAVEAGVWVFANGLTEPSDATVVRSVDGKVTTTDGP